MEFEEQKETQLVFKDICSQGEQNFQQNIIQKEQKTLKFKTQTFVQSKLDVPISDQDIYNNRTVQIESEIIEVKPCESLSLEEVQDKRKGNFIYTSQTSESSQVQIEIEKEQSYSNGNLVFQYEESDSSELSPESSLRKLYKNPIVQVPSRSCNHQPSQKLIKRDIVQKKPKMQQQEIEQYEQDLNSEEEQDELQLRKKKQLKSDRLIDLVIFPIPKTKMIRCLVVITNNNFFSLERIFDLYLVQEKKHLLRAKKKKFRIYSTFQIFGKDSEHNKAIATIRSNFTRTQYKLIKYETETQLTEHHSVQQPSAFSSDIIKVQTVSNDNPPQIIEEQCSYIGYQSNFLGFSQQKLTMLKPRKKLPITTDRFSNLKTAFQNCEYERVLNYSTRMAEKGLDGKLVLDFKDKTITNSSRNMILQNENSEVGLMFAKVSDDIFILNVMNPFNILQGFFLGLCNLDKKPFVS